MKINSISLENFRNISSLSLEFEDTNIIWGENAQGKTNLLETIYYSAIGKSPRTTKDADLINWNKDKASFVLSLQKKEGKKIRKEISAIQLFSVQIRFFEQAWREAGKSR